MKKFIMIPLCMLALGVSACNTTQGMGNKQLIGTGAGAIGGGLLGSQIGSGSGRLWATGAGVLLGGLLGSEIGSSLDRADMAYAQQANERAYTAPIGERIVWSNPNSGNSGYIVPTRDGYSSSGRYCREYQQHITVGGRTQSGYGQACQQPDGTWEIVS